MASPYQIPNPVVVASDSVTAPPTNSVGNNTLYLLLSTPSGDWVGYINYIAVFWTGEWTMLAPSKGMLVLVTSTGKWKTYTGAAWCELLDCTSDYTDLANVDDSSKVEGSFPYYDLTTTTWKTTGSGLTFDDGGNVIKAAADATTSTALPRLSQLNSTAATANHGAKAVGLYDVDGNYAATTVEGALAEAATLSLKPFTHTAYRSGSFTDGQAIRVFLNTTDNDANFVIPAGETLKILAAFGRCKSGSNAGTTIWTLGIRSWETQAHAGALDHVLATGETIATDAFINISARGTLASPLATIVGDDDPVGMCYIQHDHSGGRGSASDKHTIMVYGVFVDD